MEVEGPSLLHSALSICRRVRLNLSTRPSDGHRKRLTMEDGILYRVWNMLMEESINSSTEAGAGSALVYDGVAQTSHVLL